MRYPNYKNIVVKRSLRLLFPLIFASLCLSHKTPAVDSNTYLAFILTLLLFHLGNVLKGPLTKYMNFQRHVTPHSTV